jgi:hypothetical protein
MRSAIKVLSCTIVTFLGCGGHGESTGLGGEVLGETKQALSNGWTYTTGHMNYAREEHTATLLGNGTVLIAGGSGSTGGAVGVAELYNPSTGTFTTTGTMATPRSRHTATLLGNGKVLLAGGLNNSGVYTASAELYDPATGHFTATGSLNQGREQHSAALLGSGKVLIAGGDQGNTTGLRSSELYNPTTGTFAYTGNLVTGRVAQPSPPVLNDGTVLLVGSYFAIANGTAEIYQPTTGTWSQVSAPINSGTTNATTTLLNTGKVLAVFNGAYLYDPATKAFTGTGTAYSFSEPDLPPLTPLTSGKVLLEGGGNSLCQGFPHTDTCSYTYDPSSALWSKTGWLNQGRWAHTATRLQNGSVLAAGGRWSGPLASAELYTP